MIIGLFSLGGCSDTSQGDSDAGAMDIAGSQQDARKDSKNNNCSGAFKIEDLSGNPGKETRGKDYIFDQQKLHTFKLEVKPDDWKWLQENALKETYVAAKVVFEGNRYLGAAVRYKGDWTSLKSCFDSTGKLTCKKLSLKVRFNKYDRCGRFHGLRRINFNSSIVDKSLMRERITWNLMRDVGLRASQASHALVSVNGISLGIFVMVEPVDKELLEDHFADAEGNLYKQVWPSYDYPDIYIQALRTNEDDNPSVARMIQFAAALKKATKSTAVKDLSPFIDLKRFSRALAAHLVIGNYDGPFTIRCWDAWCVNNNYYLYDEPGAQIAMLPWDLDNAFYITPKDFSPSWWTTMPKSCDPVIPCEFLGTKPCPPATPLDNKIKLPPCDPLLRLPVEVYPDEYLEMLKKLPAALTKAATALQQYRTQVKAAVAADANGPGSSVFAAECDSLKKRLTDMSTTVQAYLDKK